MVTLLSMAYPLTKKSGWHRRPLAIPFVTSNRARALLIDAIKAPVTKEHYANPEDRRRLVQPPIRPTALLSSCNMNLSAAVTSRDPARSPSEEANSTGSLPLPVNPNVSPILLSGTNNSEDEDKRCLVVHPANKCNFAVSWAFVA